MSKAGIIIVSLIVLMVFERIFPAVRVRENLARLGRNFGLAAINALLSPLVVLPLTNFAAPWVLHWRPENLVFDLLLLDLWIYFWHRLNHIVPFLWRFHEVHHLDETLDASSALRFHFGEVFISSVARAGIIIVLGVSFRSVVVFETVLAVATMFHHSNLQLPKKLEKFLSYLVVTPSIHWVHHHAKQEDTDSNYSTVLSIWDHLFRSRSAHQREIDMKIGVENSGDEPIARLILRPFYKA
jgi:sterol desaturase/sphingolipid hydroxylase (fatty acid hydroxylase superfamily)